MTDTQSRLERIAEIDKLFGGSTAWGAWMVPAANEREKLVGELRKAGVIVEDKHLARTSGGGRTT